MCGIVPPFHFIRSRHGAQLNAGNCISTLVGLEPVYPVSSVGRVAQSV